MSLPDILLLVLCGVTLALNAHTTLQNRKLDREIKDYYRKKWQSK